MADMLNKKLVIHPFDLNQFDETTNKVDETTFLEVTTIGEYWSFLQIVLLPSIYEESEKDEMSDSLSKPSDLYLQTENLLLGPPRLRQLRVQNGSCLVHKLFATKFRDCYASFSIGDEEREPFGKGVGTA